MPSLAFQTSDYVITPLIEYLRSPDSSVSVGISIRNAEKLNLQYQRSLAAGIISLIYKDVSAARTHFNLAIKEAPEHQFAFVISNIGVSFNTAKLYKDEYDYVSRSVGYPSLRLLQYAFFLSAKWCDYDLFIKVVRYSSKFSFDLYEASDNKIYNLIISARNMITILNDASEVDKKDIKIAASLIQLLSEAEELNNESTTLWRDNEGCYCYSLFLNGKESQRYKELDLKLKESIFESKIDFVHVFPLIIYGDNYAC